jgi:DNA-binding SARP family transcriptional activator
MDLGHYHLIATMYALRCGEIGRAVEHAEKGIGMMPPTGLPFAEANMHLFTAQALHEQGAHRQAARHLEIAHRLSRQMKSLIMDYVCLLTRAQFAIEGGAVESDGRGLKVLREAMRLGREQGYVNMPGWRPWVMAKLCAKALEHHIEVDYVQHLIRTRDLVPDTALAGCEHWPWPMKIYTLGRFSVVKDGNPIRAGARGQGRVLELLKVLIALGGREVEEARLAEALWPEADGDIAHQAFKTTLHRLRKLLGSDEVVCIRDGRVTLDARSCWVDVWAFERLVGTHEPGKRGVGEFATSSLEKAVALYQGHFLGGETGSSWAMALRERLHAKFLRGVSELACRWEAAGEWKQAASCYQRGLAVDPLVEEYYQRLMICHQRQGQRAEAVSVYQRCREVLQASLGIAPSPETEAMRRSVTASSNLISVRV